jgi:putative DNA primase/helicase
MLTFAKYTSSRKGIENMIALARSELAVEPEQFDRDPWLFNLQNGTLELKTGRLREHRREDFITKLCPVTINPTATCPLWDCFLDKVLGGNEGLKCYLQRLVGYSLTGVTSEHVLPFLYGSGANGKSTFIETVINLMGPDYAMKAAKDLLLTKRGESHPTELADLHGKRFVACIETEDGRRLAEALAKELTGGDRVRARRMRQDFWEYVPTHHIWIASNHKPAVTGTDHGLWRRIKLIPFDVCIPRKEQHGLLKEDLKEELPGILNWALAGCMEWQSHGLGEPKAVRAATIGYYAEQDVVGRFISDYCEQGADLTEAAGALYKAFRLSTGSTLTQPAFGRRLRDKGFANRRENGSELRTTKGLPAWRGLKLRPGAGSA